MQAGSQQLGAMLATQGDVMREVYDSIVLDHHKIRGQSLSKVDCGGCTSLSALTVLGFHPDTASPSRGEHGA